VVDSDLVGMLLWVFSIDPFRTGFQLPLDLESNRYTQLVLDSKYLSIPSMCINPIPRFSANPFHFYLFYLLKIRSSSDFPFPRHAQEGRKEGLGGRCFFTIVFVFLLLRFLILVFVVHPTFLPSLFPLTLKSLAIVLALRSFVGS